MEARFNSRRKPPTRFKRRLATILFADAADFCRLMGANEELTLSRLLAYRQIHEEIVSSECGRMFGVAGDSWMAEFLSPVEAVRCAAECQRTIEAQNAKLPEEERIRFRIGIHMGDVIANNGNLFGDDVNIAARLGGLCRPGHLVVSEDVFRRVFEKVELRFSTLGPQRLKNISNAVTAFSAEVKLASIRRAPLSQGAEIFVAAPTFRDKPTIAVLSFQTLGDESRCAYFKAKFAEALVNGLSNLRWLSVISRRASFLSKDNTIDMVTIGRTLGAYYLVTGSVLRTAGDFRLSVNLLDAGNGMDLWSQNYRIGAPEFSSAVREISASIVCILDSEIERVEQMRVGTREIEDASSWDLVRHGMLLFRKFIGECADYANGDAALAGRCFEEAIKRDPGSSEARIQLARWHLWAVWQKRNLVRLRIIERLAREAILIDQFDARAYHLLGFARMVTGRLKEARAYYHDAIALNPSLSSAHASLGLSYTFAGKPEEAIAPLLTALRLNPNDQLRAHYLSGLASTFYMQGDWDEACEFAGRALQLKPNYWYAQATRLASLAKSGKSGEPGEQEPFSHKFQIERIEALPFVDKKWNAQLLQGLRLAGCNLVK